MTQENPYAPPKAEVQDVSADSKETKLASRGLRLGGAILDAIIQAIVAGIVMAVIGFWDVVVGGGTSELRIVLQSAIIGISSFLLLNGYLLAKRGQTIGKVLVGTRIVSAETGELLPFGKLVGLRYIPLWIVGLIPGVGIALTILDSLFIFRDDRRCIHDLIAGTKVITTA
jgi:uncharacterized RDD family membrane protein YckC